MANNVRTFLPGQSEVICAGTKQRNNNDHSLTSGWLREGYFDYCVIQPATVSGPPEYSGTLLKDLMIKKANDTFFKTFGGRKFVSHF